MHKPSIGLSLEGMPFIFLTTVATLTFAVLDCWFMATLLLVVLFLVLNFFRDPERENLADFYYRADRALDGSDAYLTVTDGNLNQLMNTRAPFGSPLGEIADIETARRALLPVVHIKSLY